MRSPKYEEAMAKNKSKNKKDNKDTEVKVEIKDGNAREDEIIDIASDENEDEKTEKNSADEENGESEIEKLENKLKDEQDRYLRLAAEFDNFKKRTARQFEEMRSNAKVSIFNQFLEVIDNFERAVESAGNSSDYDSLLKGTELIYQQFKNILQHENVTPIETVGNEFDPNLHEAIMQIESDEYDEGIIAQEMLGGYKMGDRVLRFAKVAVSKGKPEENDEEEAK